MFRVLDRPASWGRALRAIVPYFCLLGKYAWLRFENNLLRAKIIELKFERKYLRILRQKGFLATLIMKR